MIFLLSNVSLGSVALSQWDCREMGTAKPISVVNLVSGVEPGSTLFLGEAHYRPEVAQAQTQILQELRRQGHSLDVALEFFSYPQQGLVDTFLKGEISEPEFLEGMNWKNPESFEFYRTQALFPMWDRGERTLAINAPAALTKSIAKLGLEGLTEIEKALLPPQLELGRADYYERFQEPMKDHIKQEDLRRYFEAQSVWDDTMAWRLAQRDSPNTQVVIVGEFHVAFGGGLPHRLSVRKPGLKSKTVSFLNHHGMSEAEVAELLQPHQRWGQRADILCLLDLPENQ